MSRIKNLYKFKLSQLSFHEQNLRLFLDHLEDYPLPCVEHVYNRLLNPEIPVFPPMLDWLRDTNYEELSGKWKWYYDVITSLDYWDEEMKEDLKEHLKKYILGEE